MPEPRHIRSLIDVERRALAWFGSAALTAVVIGMIAGAVGWALAVVFGGWIVFHTYTYVHFRRWLVRSLGRAPDLAEPWFSIADFLYRRRRRSRDRTYALIHQLRQLTTFSDALPDAAVVIDRDGVIQWVSPRAGEYLGLHKQDRGKVLTALVRNPELVRWVGKQHDDTVLEMRSPVAEERVLEVRVADLDQDYRLVLARDTTQLTRLLTMRQDFVANVSHELRTPLTVISGYVEQLAEPNIDDASLRKIAPRLLSPAARMKSLVDDLLLLTRLESDETPALSSLDLVDVASMLRGMSAESKQLGSEATNVVLDVDARLFVRAVEPELYSAINNLLVNAIHYSPDNGEITLRWQYTATAEARFTIEDHGVGIAPEHLPRITERFYRVDTARSRSLGGTGLGLAIVKHVLRRHGSELHVRSQLGSGTTFWFDLGAARVQRRVHT